MHNISSEKCQLIQNLVPTVEVANTFCAALGVQLYTIRAGEIYNTGTVEYIEFRTQPGSYLVGKSFDGVTFAPAVTWWLKMLPILKKTDVYQQRIPAD